MSVTPELPPRQRAGREKASKLRAETIDALQPLHDALLTEAPDSFDGLVTFVIDTWHQDTASAVATLQPPSDDSDRFAFYKDNIEHNRIDLSATAFGDAMRRDEAAYLRSRMNPKNHVTYTPRVQIDQSVLGGVQAAFNTSFGALPTREQLTHLWKDHESTIASVMHEFEQLVTTDNIRSIGDTLELLAPTTPNAYVISWDMAGSTRLALSHNGYGALRDYLLDVKGIFTTLTAPFSGNYHDNGDGQDMLIWLPKSVDRANPNEVAAFGHTTVLPLLRTIQAAQQELTESDYTDITPQVRFTVGLAHVEKNHFEGLTARELWEINEVMNIEPRSAVGFTKAARAVLRLSQTGQTKTPQ